MLLLMHPQTLSLLCLYCLPFPRPGCYTRHFRLLPLHLVTGTRLFLWMTWTKQYTHPKPNRTDIFHEPFHPQHPATFSTVYTTWGCGRTCARNSLCVNLFTLTCLINFCSDSDALVAVWAFNKAAFYFLFRSKASKQQRRRLLKITSPGTKVHQRATRNLHLGPRCQAQSSPMIRTCPRGPPPTLLI